MSASTLKKIHRETRAILRKHPKMSYQEAQRQAGKRVSSGTVTGRKKAARKKLAPKKKKVGAKYKVYHEVKRVGSVAATEKMLKDQLKQKLAWELLAKESAHSVKAKKAASKKIAETKHKLKAVGGLKKKAARKRRR